MKVNHYVTLFSDKNVIPSQKTIKVNTTDVKQLSLTKDIYRVILFDRYVGDVEIKGKKIKVASQRLNQKLFHIGKYENLDKLSKKDPFFVELAKNGDCIGMVTSPSGMETLVFRGEGIVDPFNKKEKLIKDSDVTEKINDENENATPKTKTTTEKKTDETTI